MLWVKVNRQNDVGMGFESEGRVQDHVLFACSAPCPLPRCCSWSRRHEQGTWWAFLLILNILRLVLIFSSLYLVTFDLLLLLIIDLPIFVHNYSSSKLSSSTEVTSSTSRIPAQGMLSEITKPCLYLIIKAVIFGIWCFNSNYTLGRARMKQSWTGLTQRLCWSWTSVTRLLSLISLLTVSSRWTACLSPLGNRIWLSYLLWKVQKPD